MSIFPWLVCPECQHEEFGEDDVTESEAVCPSCGATTSLPTSTENHRGGEDLLETLSDREATAHDAPEVTDEELSFQHDESVYQAGQRPFYCGTCGEECVVTCGRDGQEDVAYCQSCHIQYTRSRTPLVDDISNGMTIETHAEEREAYDEYECEHCGESHPYTRPEGAYSSPNPVVRSYERTWFTCPCGATLSGAFEPHDTVNCPSCPRTYTLQMDFHEGLTDEYEAFETE